MLSGKTDGLGAGEAGLLSTKQLGNLSAHGMYELPFGFNARLFNGSYRPIWFVVGLHCLPAFSASFDERVDDRMNIAKGKAKEEYSIKIIDR